MPGPEQPRSATTELTAEDIERVHTAFFAQHNMSLLLDQLPVALWVKDAQGRYVGANQQWLDDEAFDSVADVAGKNDYDLFEAVRAAASIRRDWEMLDEGRPLITADIVERNGEAQTLRTTRMPIRDADQHIVGALGFTQATEPAPTEAPTPETPLEIDPITGVGVKAALIDRLSELIDSEEPGSLVLFSLDDHGIVSDSLGLEFGDMLLRAAARRLTTAFGPLLFRNREDEFAVVLPTTDPAQLADIGQMMLNKWRQALVIDGNHIYGSISVGMTSLADRTRASLVLQDAELAVNEAKRSGGSQVAVYSPEQRRNADDQLAQQMLVRRAVADKEFNLHWQPIVSSISGRTAGFEALLRWRPAGGSQILPAAEFFPFLERSGLIVQLGQFVIEEACRQHIAWREHNSIKAPIPVHVNVSARQFMSGLLATDIISTLENTGVSPDMLVIEVVESAVADPSMELLKDLAALRDAGVRVAIDNFGASHSSVSSVENLPIDIAKVDRRLASRIVAGNDEPIIDALGSVLSTQGITPIVQGVENELQMDWLQSRGWDLVQGYHVGAPLDPHDVTTLLTAHV